MKVLLITQREPSSFEQYVNLIEQKTPLIDKNLFLIEAIYFYQFGTHTFLWTIIFSNLSSTPVEINNLTSLFKTFCFKLNNIFIKFMNSSLIAYFQFLE